MADRILSVQWLYLTQSADFTSPSGSAEIDIPSPQEVQRSWGSYNTNGAQWFPADAVTYVFDGSNTADLELVQSGSVDGLSTEGIKLVAGTEKTNGPWRLRGGPPHHVYLPTSGSNQVRVTVVLGR